MLTDTQAQRIASQWHGGQTSGLYALSSSGAITYTTADEIAAEISASPFVEDDERDLMNLYKYITHHGPRPAVPDWYARVICAPEGAE